MCWKQLTIRQIVSVEGIGVHSGIPIQMKLLPAPKDHGIVFYRTDLSDPQKSHIKATYSNVSFTEFCTVVSNEYGASVYTVEHLISALCALGIDNLRIELSGAEVPIMDGSSINFLSMIEELRCVCPDSTKKVLQIIKPVFVENPNWKVGLLPSDSREFDITIDFPNLVIGKQRLHFNLSYKNYRAEIAKARTFCTKLDVEFLRARHLALGGSLDNAIVVDEDKILNEGGLRYEDEFVRHKILDAIGDTYLCGFPILGKFTSYKGGHTANNQLLRELFKSPENYKILDLELGSPIDPLIVDKYLSTC